MSKFSIISNDFVDGGEIPKECGYKHGNEEPHIDFIPGETEPFPWAMIMDDPDAMKAVGKVWVHWVLWNIEPNVVEFKENSIPSDCLEGKTDFGEIGYGGPAPPDKEHTYIFKLYALDQKLDVDKGSTKKQIEEAIKNHIISETRLEGKYSP